MSAALTSRDTTRPRLLHTAITRKMASQGADIHAQFTIYEPGLPVTYPESDLAAHLNLNGRLLDTKIQALRACASPYQRNLGLARELLNEAVARSQVHGLDRTEQLAASLLAQLAGLTT